MNLFKYYCNNKERIKEFSVPTRSSSSLSERKKLSKVEQSVDFTERNGSTNEYLNV